MIDIRKELCIGCGACIKDCPGGALKLDEDKAVWIRTCIQCGHCVAICPAGAVSIPDYDMDDVKEYQEEEFTISPEIYLNAVKFRRSIRQFKQEPIKREVMETILDAGRYTATAKNMQDVTFVLVQEQLDEWKSLVWQELPGVIEALRESKPDYAKAFSYFYKKWNREERSDNLFFDSTAFLAILSENPLDGALAAANIENMAAACKAGVLYSGYLQAIVSASPVLKEWLEAGEKKLSCCMLMGYPSIKYRRTAPRKKADIHWR